MPRTFKVTVQPEHWPLGEADTVDRHPLTLAIEEATGLQVVGYGDGDDTCFGTEDPINLDPAKPRSVTFNYSGPYYPLPEAAANFLRRPEDDLATPLPLTFDLTVD